MGLKVRDLMSSDPVYVRPSDSLDHVWDTMNNRNFRHMPVCNEDGELEGLISHRDLMGTALYTTGDMPYSEVKDFLSSTKASEAMTNDPETIDEELSILEAGRMMMENKYGCLPVVGVNSKLVGVLTESDFIKHVVAQEEAE